MSDTHNKDSTQHQGKGMKTTLSADQEQFARQCVSNGIASYEDVVQAYQSNDQTSIKNWQSQMGSTSTQREKASPGT